jgi:hypothetical protein
MRSSGQMDKIKIREQETESERTWALGNAGVGAGERILFRPAAISNRSAGWFWGKVGGARAGATTNFIFLFFGAGCLLPGKANAYSRPAADDRLIELSVLNRTLTLDAVLSSTFGPHSKRSAAHR